MVELLAFIVGLAAGAVALWLWARAVIDGYRGRLAAADEKLALVEKTDRQWEDHLRAATGEAIERSSKSLIEQTDARLAPIKETLARFDEQARTLEQTRITAIAGVREQMRAVAEGQNLLQKETGNLVTALRTPHVRGRWGEVQLRRVVELAGMVAHCDFVEQASERTDEGRLLRPDLVVKLPGGKSLVVDSKASFAAYLDAIQAEDDESKRVHLGRHAKLIRDHMTSLAQKQYWKQFDPAPEFVVMFIPDESSFRAAVDQDPALLEAGFEMGVIPASPATLIAVLRTVATIWQHETAADSARAVSKLGRELYDRLGVFSSHLAGVGKSLDAAVSNYNRAVASFDSRVLVSARKFPELGTGGDELPEITPVSTRARPLLATADDDGVVELPTRAADAA